MNRENIKKQCYDIYKLSFPEPESEFENLLFETCFEFCKYKIINQTVVSMFFALPCSLITEKSLSATYIFAAATHPDYRKKGFMAEILNNYLKDNNNPVFLRPANQNLIDFYKKFGFTCLKGINKISSSNLLKPQLNYEKIGDTYKDLTGTEFTLMSRNSPKIIEINFPFSMY